MLSPFLALRMSSLGRVNPIKEFEVQNWLTCLLSARKGDFQQDQELSVPKPDFTKLPPIAVGVSGGADSILLAYLLSKVVDSTKLHGLVVDHELRPESKKEAEFAMQTLMGLGINCSLLNLKWDTEGKESNFDLNASTKLRFGQMNYYAGKPLPTGSRLEVAAREARYAAMVKAMGHTDSRVLTLGHHGNDLAETFLFRFFRESGLAGLTGMNPLRSIPLSLLDVEGWSNSEALRKLKLFRPMLMVSKKRIYDTCNFYGLKWVEDPTNVCSTSVQQRAVIRAEMKKWEADSCPEKAPLQFKALMNTVTHFAEHNRAINSRILHLVSKEVQFNPTYGICELHVPIRPSSQHWLSNPYLACRILSTLSQWIACSDHAPGLGSVRTAYSAMLGLPSSHIASDKTTTFCLQIGFSMLVSPTKKNPYWAMCRSPFPREKLKALTFALDLLIPDSSKDTSAVKIAPIWKTLWDQRYYIYVAAKCDFRQDKNLLLWAKLFLPGIQSLPLGDDLVQFILQPLNQDLISSLRNKHVVFGRKLPTPLKTNVSDASFKLYNLQKQVTVKTVRSTVPVVVMRIHTARLGEFASSHLVGKMKHKFVDVPIAFPTLKDFTIFPDLFTVRSEHNFPRLTEIFS